MIWGYGLSWGGMFLMSIGMVLWIALLVVLVWAVIRWLDRRTSVPGPGPAVPVNEPSALEILRRRYARGEIDTATFEQMCERLERSMVHEPRSSMRS
jgi:putative membrane protein